MHPVLKLALLALVVLPFLRPSVRRWFWWRIARNEARRQRLGVALCPACVRRLPLRRHFCFWCATPVSGYAATGPIEYVAAQGELYRRGVSRPTPLAVLGLWLLALPGPLLLLAEVLASGGRVSLETFGWLPVYLLPVAVALKATRRFRDARSTLLAGNA
jgi:hypothetical protein